VRRRARNVAEEPGQDSFLDVVANLVGILIILVMIVGAQAKDALIRAETATAAPSTQDAEEGDVEEEDIEDEKNALAAVRHDLQRLIKRTKQQNLEIAYRRFERNRILDLIAESRSVLQEQRQKLTREQQEAHDLQSEIAGARREFDDLKMSIEAAGRATAPVRVVKHRPTPLAKTVFGKEVHFRLKAGRLVFLPIDELVEQFKIEARQKAWKLRQAPAITETVGPIQGFRLKYTLTKKTHSLQTRSGTAYQERVELDHFVLVPVRDDLGEPMDEALQPQSQFRSILNSLDPNQTTVTVWIYPDSFDKYRRLKEDIYQLGFLTASRPMPEGMPISGAPDGVRSAAQ